MGQLFCFVGLSAGTIMVQGGEGQMLAGENHHSLDAKNRLFIPAKFLSELGGNLMVVRDLRTKCLKLFSEAGWDAYLAPILEKNRSLAERTIRALHRSAVSATADSQGRILLTPALLQCAEIQKNVVIVGCYHYAEIWSEENWQKQIEEEDADAIRRELEALGL